MDTDSSSSDLKLVLETSNDDLSKDCVDEQKLESSGLLSQSEKVEDRTTTQVVASTATSQAVSSTATSQVVASTATPQAVASTSTSQAATDTDKPKPTISGLNIRSSSGRRIQLTTLSLNKPK